MAALSYSGIPTNKCGRDENRRRLTLEQTPQKELLQTHHTDGCQNQSTKSKENRMCMAAKYLRKEPLTPEGMVWYKRRQKTEENPAETTFTKGSGPMSPAVSYNDIMNPVT